ncbi:PTS system mannose/fructose/sorbose family transporter subunit IID [Lacticaseibacillus suihuaensis]
MTKTISKKALRQTWFAWQSWGQICYNYERMMGLGFAHAMSYTLADLYPDDDDALAAGLTRELTYFNTENTWGAMIPGIVASLEEQKANGQPVSGDMINNLKAALMGPLAGIGDTITQSLVKVILLGIGIDMAKSGSALGPILFVLLFCAYALIVGHTTFYAGYRLGKTAVTNLLAGGRIARVTEAIGALGMMVLGALIPTTITVTTPLKATFGQLKLEPQKILDSVVPSLLPLVAFVILYLLLKKGVRPTRLMVGLIAFAVVAGLLGILA